MSAEPGLTVVIPTHERLAALRETLALVGPQAEATGAEVIAVDDGSSDGTENALAELAVDFPAPLRTARLERNRGPGAARNRGLELARAPVCLLLGDDMRPTPGLLARHVDFHRRHPATGDALLGRIVPSANADSPFARWLHEQGKQFAFARMDPDEPVPSELFYATNCSLKVELMRAAGGFDQRFRFGHEEQELARRLDAAGLRLAYDPLALVEHDHPTDLRATLERMRAFGGSYRRLTELVASEPSPRRPGPRHLLKASALTLASLIRPRPRRVRELTWEFLCEEAHREGFWEVSPAPDAGVRVGAALARIAERDPAVRSAGAPAR